MKFIDWRKDFNACVVVKGIWRWKRYAAVELTYRTGYSPAWAWCFVENLEGVDDVLSRQLFKAQLLKKDADRAQKISSPWKQHRIASAEVVHRRELKHSGSD